ncbi:MAG: TonB-dependent receptor [Desulfobulbaceae bacterium]|nr:TonB-dependent receptor [Desulfobulbaceae bacterium]
MNKLFSVVLATIALLPAQLRAAELANKETVPNRSESVAVLDEVVVTATKTEEKRRDIANAVVVKDALEIGEAPAESLGALLANEPGIDWRTRGNYGGAAEEIQIRGMGADGTLLVVDGVALNSPSLGSADVSHISLNSIERIEVVKGPGSLLYGSGAMGGTVNIISKKPKRDGYTAKVEAGYGSESTSHLAAESGGFVAGDFGYYLTANRKETDGFRDNGDLEHTDVALNLLFDRGERFQADFNFGYVERDYGLPGVKPPAGTVPFSIGAEQFYNAETANRLDRGEDQNRHSSLALKGRAGELLNWRLKGDCAVLESFNHSRYSYNGSGDDTEVSNTVRGIEGNLDLHPTPYLGLLVGSEYRNFAYENALQPLDPSGAPVAGGLTISKHRVFTNGTFAELNLKPVEQVKLTAGYRYEEHSRFGHENVARYGLVVKPLAETAVKVNHGKHFKAPTMNDLFWPDDGAFTKGNPNLQPESGWHTDVTVEQSLLAGKLFATVSWFKWDINDKIAWAEDPTQPSPVWGNYWTPSNINSYRASGWEGEVKIGPYSGVRGDLALTLLDAEEELQAGATRAARYSPEIQVKAGLSHYADFGLTSTVTARYVGARPGYYADPADLVPEIELDSYWTVDLKLEQELAEHWHLTLLATNLLDEEYDTYLAGFSDQNTFAYTQEPYPGAGRSLFASVAYAF